MKPPKTAKEEWERITELASGDDEDDAIAKMSEAEVDRALAEAGFDVAAETAKGRAEHDASVAPSPPKMAPRSIRPSRGSGWFAVPAALLVAAGIAVEIAAPPAVLVGGAVDAGVDAGGDAGEREAGPRR